jgi:hypothetical protein
MAYSKKEIRHLQQYCARMLPKWRQKISTNIVGVHVGFRNCQGKKRRQRAIVFHVQQKLSVPLCKIPTAIQFTYNKEKRKIITDVIETGTTKLMNVFMGDKAQSIIVDDEFGTAGLFLDINGVMHVCSNMHVLAPQHISSGTFSADPSQQFSTDVVCFNNSTRVEAFLAKGEFSTTDIAIARVQFPQQITPRIKGLGIPSGFLNDNQISVGMFVQMFGARSNTVITGEVEATGVARTIRYDNITIEIPNLVATSLPVRHGDSGSAVVNEFLEVVGIVVSIDEVFAYVIPWSSIDNFIRDI